MSTATLVIIVIVIIGLIRLGRLFRKNKVHRQKELKPLNLSPWQKKIYTVLVFTKLNTKRFFRDRLALFFGVLFPLIFLFVFGAITHSGGKLSFNVAVINQSKTSYAKAFVSSLEHNSIYKISKSATTLSVAENKMTNDQLNSTILIPSNFGVISKSQTVPTGTVKVLYTENQASAGVTLTSVLQGELNKINGQYVTNASPFKVSGDQLSQKSLTTFDYTFSGLLGFSIMGIGIFGPINVFPELKKQGILRRLHTTPIRVWQYFMATMFSQAITGIVGIAVQFIVAITVFDLKIDGNYLEILIFTIFSIFMILGIGLAIGGWAKNERQAAPLSNIIVFPMMFLSGTFFPRFEMPQWLQSATNYLPLTPVIDGLRYLTTDGKSLLQIGPQIGLIAAWMVIIYVIAFRVFKWE